MKKALLALATAALGTLGLNAQNGAPLYVTGAGSFVNGEWNAETPDELTYSDGKYTIEVNDLTQFKISTDKGSWALFDAGVYGCSYGSQPGVAVTLEAGYNANIGTPWKGDYTVTVAGDLSTITLTTTTPQPTEGPAIYLRGDMNSWAASAEWQMEATEDPNIYKFVCGAGISIGAGKGFKIADADWNLYNIGAGSSDAIELNAPTQVYNGGNPMNMSLAEAWDGICWLNLDVNGDVYVAFSNDKTFVPVWQEEEFKVSLCGEFNGWSTEANVFTTTDGVNYTCQVASLKDEFKILAGTDWYGMTEDSLILGDSYVLSTSGDNCRLLDQDAHDLTLNFNVNTHTLKITGTGGGPVIDGFVTVEIGNFGGTPTSLVKNSDGTWSADVELEQAAMVLMWLDGEMYGADQDIAETGKAYSLAQFAFPTFNLPTGVYTVVFNEPDMTVTFNGGDAPVDKYYGIHGNIFGGSWNTLNLTNEDGKWVGSAPIVPGEFGIKIMDADGNQLEGADGWIGGAAEVTEAGYPYTVISGDNSTSTLEGDYTITYDPAAGTITFTEAEIEKVITYALRGTIFDGENWLDQPMTENGEAWEWSGDVVAGTFGIQLLTNGVQTDWIAAANGQTEIAGAGDYPAGNLGVDNWTSTINGEGTFSYNPETNILTLKNVVGITEINVENGAVKYFDLQGNRIAEPANGIFIRVQDGKATKIAK